MSRTGGKIKHVKVSKPEWLIYALESLRPPELMTVTQWCDKHRVLDHTSAFPGQWHTSLTPYLAGYMDAFTDPEIEEAWFCKPTQVGGTEGMFNMLAYAIAQDPAPSMLVYPNQQFAKHYSKTRVQPMVALCPKLNEKHLDRESEDMLLQFMDMNLHFAGAQTDQELAGFPICYLFLDEVDKFPKRTAEGSDPINQATERAKTFKGRHKIIGASTPTNKLGNIWKVRDHANEVREYYCPCPHCGHYQTLRFPQVKWPEECKTNPDMAKDLAYYECEECRGRINDAHKAVMLQTGEWRATEKRGNGRAIVWFHLNSLYSPWVRIGEMAQKFLRSKDISEELHNFVNSWLGEPWEDRTMSLESDLILSKCTDIPEGTIPKEAQLLTAGVDVQHDSFYWTIRAWGSRFTSWNIAHGHALDWQDVEAMMNREWRKVNGEKMIVSLCAIDSGDQTDMVYDICAMNSEWAIPVKGSSKPLLQPYRISLIDKAGSRAQGMRLIMVDSHQYKTMIASRIGRPNGRGSWMLHANCDRDYAEQIASEQRVPEERGNTTVMVWVPKTAHAANHYLAAEAYCFCAADLMGARYLDDEAENK